MNGAAGEVGEVLHFHSEAEVGPVGPEPFHRLGVIEPGQGGGDVLAGELLGKRLDEPFHRFENVLELDEGHLDVELSELGLTIGAEVLVSEATGDLEVAVHPGDHQQLLVKLRALGQGVEVSGMNPARDEEVTGPFRGAPAEDRRLDLPEAQVGHRPPHRPAPSDGGSRRSVASPRDGGRGSGN